MADQIKNVFISHVHKDDNGLAKVRSLLETKGMSIRDYSINSSNPNNAKSPDYIKSQILTPRIQEAGTFVVYISPTTKNSEYVNWEIETAHRLGRRIVGVWAHGHKDCELPDALNNFGDALVGWTGDKIIDAKNGDCDDWEKQDGTPYENRPITRHRC